MVEISNIPVKKEEKLKSIITAVATIMNVNNFSYDDDADVAHRLNGKFPHHLLSCSAAKQKETSFMRNARH